MTNQVPQQTNYQRSIVVNCSAVEAYQALTTGFSNWWTITHNQSFRHIGDSIKFTFPPQESDWTFSAIALEPNTFIELECTGAKHIMLDKPNSSTTEWLSTKLQWRIESDNAKTHIHFLHEGLVPELDCYDVCEAGWDFFFMQSLKAYLDTGVGTPHQEAS